MSGVTDNPNDQRLKQYHGKGHDESPVPQQDAYLVLPPEDRAKGFVRPCRDSYRHTDCDGVTTMGRSIAETYARDPWFYGGTYCVPCAMHRPLSEFTWIPTNESLDPRLWPEDITQEVMRLREDRDA